MISAKQYSEAVSKSVEMLKAAGIVITPEEKDRFEVADFGLSKRRVVRG